MQREEREQRLLESVFATAAATAANRCSMLADLERGAPPELDAIVGHVTAEARRLRVPTPWLSVLEALVRALTLTLLTLTPTLTHASCSLS